MKPAREYRIIALRDCPMPESMPMCDTPALAAHYWRAQVIQSPAYNPAVENAVVLLLNTRRRIIGHTYVSTGTLDTLLVHPREVFRAAIIANSAAIIIGHNHPSGECIPSEADIKVTRELTRAGQILKIEVLDHIIIGAGETYASLRELGYFYS